MDETTFSPIASDRIGVRIRHALGMSNAELAKALNVSVADVAALMSAKANQLVAVDMDPTWYALAEYIDQRIGELVAARLEIQTKLHEDRKRRALRRSRIRGRK